METSAQFRRQLDSTKPTTSIGLLLETKTTVKVLVENMPLWNRVTWVEGLLLSSLSPVSTKPTWRSKECFRWLSLIQRITTRFSHRIAYRCSDWLNWHLVSRWNAFYGMRMELPTKFCWINRWTNNKSNGSKLVALLTVWNRLLQPANNSPIKFSQRLVNFVVHLCVSRNKFWQVTFVCLPLYLSMVVQSVEI